MEVIQLASGCAFPTATLEMVWNALPSIDVPSYIPYNNMWNTLEDLTQS